MYIIGPSGKQIRLTVLHYDTSISQELNIYDHSNVRSNSYPVLSLQGDLNDPADIVSTQEGFALFFDDEDTATNGRGFTAQVYLIGKLFKQIRGVCKRLYYRLR